MRHHGHPMPQPRTDATASELTAWCLEPAPRLPERLETHLDLWLRRESLEAELECLRAQYRASDSDGTRRDLTERAGMARASINNLTERLNQLRPPEARAA